MSEGHGKSVQYSVFSFQCLWESWGVKRGKRVLRLVLTGVVVVASAVYLVAGIWILWLKRRDARALLRDGFRTPYAEMVEG